MRLFSCHMKTPLEVDGWLRVYVMYGKLTKNKKAVED